MLTTLVERTKGNYQAVGHGGRSLRKADDSKNQVLSSRKLEWRVDKAKITWCQQTVGDTTKNKRIRSGVSSLLTVESSNPKFGKRRSRQRSRPWRNHEEIDIDAVGHGGKDEYGQSIDDHVVEETGVDELKSVVVSQVSRSNRQRTVSSLCHVVVQVARYVEQNAQRNHGNHLQ